MFIKIKKNYSNKNSQKKKNSNKMTKARETNCEIFNTYIHNWPLQPFSQDYGLASETTHVVCVNFIRVWRDL